MSLKGNFNLLFHLMKCGMVNLGVRHHRNKWTWGAIWVCWGSHGTSLGSSCQRQTERRRGTCSKALLVKCLKIVNKTIRISNCSLMVLNDTHICICKINSQLVMYVRIGFSLYLSQIYEIITKYQWTIHADCPRLGSPS